VESIHILLWENERYRTLLKALYNELAIEGSLAADDFAAATMIREKALEMCDLEMRDVGTAKLADISKALGVVLRRYWASRKQRRRSGGADQ